MLPRPLRPSAPLPALLLLLLLLALFISPTSTSTVNSDAVSKAKAKAAWRKARPIGCREVKGEGSDPELPERWWCEAGAKGEKFLVRNGRRLREVAKQQEKGGKDGKAAADATNSVAEDDRRATVLLFDAVRKAAKTYSKEQAKLAKAAGKEKKGKKKGKKGASGASASATVRVKKASEYKCRKRTDRKYRSVEAMQITCFVSDYKYDGEEGEEGGEGEDGGKKKKKYDSDETPESRCERFTVWQKKYARDKSEGHTYFLTWLTEKDPVLGGLDKLKTHTEAEGGTGTGKVRQAIEGKAKGLYRKASLELHPDKVIRKLPKGCATDAMKEMLSEVFERVKRLKECILRPLRCELDPTDTGEGFAGKKKGKKKGRKGRGHQEL